MSEYAEDKRFHLKIIEDTISRMSHNSFVIKSWAITSLGGLATLYVTNKNHDWSTNLFLISAVVILLFWIEDTYYLYQEWRYRNLYDIVRNKDNFCIDFNMQAPKEKYVQFIRCLFRPVYRLSYLPIIILLLGAFLMLKHQK